MFAWSFDKFQSQFGFMICLSFEFQFFLSATNIHQNMHQMSELPRYVCICLLCLLLLRWLLQAHVQALVQDSNAVKTPDLPCHGIAFLQLSC